MQATFLTLKTMIDHQQAAAGLRLLPQRRSEGSGEGGGRRRFQGGKACRGEVGQRVLRISSQGEMRGALALALEVGEGVKRTWRPLG